MPIARVRDIDICHELHGTGPRLVRMSTCGGAAGDTAMRSA